MASHAAASNDRYNLYILFISYLIQQFIECLCILIRKICHDRVHLVAVLVHLFQELSAFFRYDDVHQSAIELANALFHQSFSYQAIYDTAGVAHPVQHPLSYL